MPTYSAIGINTIQESLTGAQSGYLGKYVADRELFIRSLGDSIIEEFSKVKLIGEIERLEGRDTYEFFKKNIRKYIDRSLLLSILRNGSRQWRAILGLYFVWAGIFEYGEESGHELWPPVFKGLDIEYDTNLSMKCGQLFMECLSENSLEKFNILAVGHHYVNRILLHGLIPERHIKRFISDIIEPELNNAMGFFSSGINVINKLIHSDSIHYLPKPIQHFVLHGRPVNSDMIGRFLEMARYWDEDEPGLWRRWGLPQYMVEAFRFYIKDSEKGSVLKKFKSNNTKRRAYIFFDLEKIEAPQLLIPPQRVVRGITLKIYWQDFNDNKHQRPIQPVIKSLNGQHHTDPLELSIGPSNSGWAYEIRDNYNKTLQQQKIDLNYPSSANGNQVPLILFNKNTTRLINTSDISRLPESVIILYPSNASIELEGGIIVTEPEELFGLWKGWKFVICILGEDFTLNYTGPDINFKSRSNELIRFSRGQIDETPFLGNGGRAPTWLRSVENWPIYTKWDEISIVCPKPIYNLWKYSFGRLIRKDKEQKYSVLKFNFEKTEDGYRSNLITDSDQEPGVYEVQLRGPLGLDTVILNFIYIPFNTLKRVYEGNYHYLVNNFSFTIEHDLVIEPHPKTRFINNNNEYCIAVKEDQGDAFCAIKFFSSSLVPTTILFARSIHRWSRRSEYGLFQWDAWNAIPEDIPMQRLDEIYDARVSIQIDRNHLFQKTKNDRKLKVVLREQLDDNIKERNLISYDAPTIKRGISDTWIIDLKRFSDQLKDISSVDSAAVISIADNTEYLLYVLKKKPEYKNFVITRVQQTNNLEKIKISWDPQRNDPLKGRIICLTSSHNPDQARVVKLDDQKNPPFYIDIELPENPGMWTAQLEVSHSRFGLISKPQSDSKNLFSWFRFPTRWSDWLEWPELDYRNIASRIGDIKLIDSSILKKSLPLTYFLNCMYLYKGIETNKIILSIVGDDTIRHLLPYTTGTVWEVRARKKIKLIAKVVSSSCDNSDLIDILEDRYPHEWYKLPSEMFLDLCLLNNHTDLGMNGTIWRCSKALYEDQIIMRSNNERILTYWIEDAVYPTDEKGKLIAKCALEHCWDDPVSLPILSDVHHRDKLFATNGFQEETRYNASQKDKGLIKLGDILKEKLSQEVRSEDTPEYKEGRALLLKWLKWTRETRANPLLVRMVSGRLGKCNINGLVGVAALLARLKAHSFFYSALKVREDSHDHEIEHLYKTTLDFVKKHSPRGLLRDLILSEVIISWYWDKEIGMN